MSKRKLIVILYSEAKRSYFSSEEQYLTEVEVYKRVKEVKKYIDKLGYKTILLPGNINSIFKLKSLRPILVFNLVDSVYGHEELISIIPAALELLKLSYTGAGVTGLAINGSKYLTKVLLKECCLPVPRFQLFKESSEELSKNLQFPLIVKLNESHGSLEINQSSVVENKKNLKKRINYLLKKYRQTVIVEEYVRGKEVTVLVIDGKEKIILAEERILFKKQKYPLYDYEAAWGEKEIYDCLPYRLSKLMKNILIKAFEVLHFKDYARFEIIVKNEKDFYIIDPNANPSFGPYGTTSGPFGYLLYLNKIPFIDVVKKIIQVNSS